MRNLASGLILLLSLPVNAAVENIMIFQNDTSMVLGDIRLPPSTVVKVYNMDDVARAQDRLAEIVSRRVSPSAVKVNPEEAHREAFQQILNSPEWDKIHADIGASTEGAEKAMRYDVKKLPAVLFNERFVVYGVSSLREAMAIFTQRESR